MAYCWHDSPFGRLYLTGDADGLTGLHFPESERATDPDHSRDGDHRPELFDKVARQLDEYFDGQRTTFDVPLAPIGTPFQRMVWQQLTEIPYGTTVTYGELARRVGNPKASRAVGLANGQNPVAIIIPCHRVIGSNGKLTGYGGGIERKRRLLDLETNVLFV